MNLQALLAHQFPTRRITYGPTDTILYALSVGVGADPCDANQLRLVYERDLCALPTMAAVLAHLTWLTNPVFEVNYLKLLHGEQNLMAHRPLPPGGEIEASYRVPAVVDKGKDKGALVYFEKTLADAATGELLSTVLSTLFLRADGGCGSHGTPPPPLPDDKPGSDAFSDEIRTPVSAALLYRLNGDLNPIHVDPDAARKAGFDRPILHGLCTYGVVGYLLVRAVCGHDPARLRSLGARFSSPVFPGESIRIEGTRDGDTARFRAVVPERNQVVLSQGCARIA